MLCDEPTGALDQENTQLILELLQKINRETGTTIVMITHASKMRQLAHRTATIRDGVISDVVVNPHTTGAAEMSW